MTGSRHVLYSVQGSNSNRSQNPEDHVVTEEYNSVQTVTITHPDAQELDTQELETQEAPSDDKKDEQRQIEVLLANYSDSSEENTTKLENLASYSMTTSIFEKNYLLGEDLGKNSSLKKS